MRKQTIILNQWLKSMALLLCLGAIASCKKLTEEVKQDPTVINPISNFEYKVDWLNAFKFYFTDLSSKYKKMEWRFGDDSISTSANPTHIYASAGKFQVSLKTTSETGNISTKMLNIFINPDSVIKIGIEKTGTPNEVKFNVKAKANVASVLWTFNDVSPAATSTSLTPVRTYVPGSFNTLTAQITTTDGSVASLTRNTATTEGFLQDITQGRDSYTVSAENTYAAAEDSQKLLDNNVETKYTMGGRDGRRFTYPLMVTLIYRNKQTVKTYAVGNSNDLPARDPKSWNIQGSNDGVNWELLDTRVMTKNFYDQMTALGATTDVQRFKKLFYYPIANPKPFTMYRWSITANWGDAAMQTNEFRLYR